MAASGTWFCVSDQAISMPQLKQMPSTTCGQYVTRLHSG